MRIMNVQKIQIERQKLNAANYNRNYHIYNGIKVIADKKADIPQSFIKVLYEIYKGKGNY